MSWAYIYFDGLQFEYLDWLAAQVGVEPTSLDGTKKIYRQLVKLYFNSKDRPYRDWDVDSWIKSNP